MNSTTQESGVTCWSTGQEAAMEKLLLISKTFFEHRWHIPAAASLRPRFDPLVAGPSGAGKSELVRMVSRAVEVPFLRLSFAEWIVAGAKESPHTLERVHAFLTTNERGIIHVDELDKFRPANTSDWSVSVLVELFHLLDRSLHQPLRQIEWTDDLRDRLARSFLIIGTGTWQQIWADFERPAVGFRSDTPKGVSAIQREIVKRGIIPTELLRRFRSQIIFLPIPEESDYRRAAEAFGLVDLAAQVGVQLDYQTAFEQGLGSRWLEETFADLLCLAREKGIATDVGLPDLFAEEEWFEDDISDSLL
jgi:ATPase family associated with various cellular activities (AAA)